MAILTIGSFLSILARLRGARKHQVTGADEDVVSPTIEAVVVM
jgi:hypothetical protein